MKPRTQIIVGIGALFAMLLGLILLMAVPLWTGTAIVLDTQPVDPFDLFRGQYIQINYEISNIPILYGAKIGDFAFVELKIDGNGFARYFSSSLTPPEGKLFIKGEIIGIDATSMRVQYPSIEQYFIEQNAVLPSGKLTVEVKLTKSGGARISRLLIDGKPAELKYR